MTSLVFPGQGSQTVGMAKDFNDNFKIASLAFEEIEDYTNINIRKIIFFNENNQLDLTQFTQICIFAASYVIYRTYIDVVDIDKENIKVMMGHSLGEYTALACSNRISLKDCSLILKRRGELMNNAVEPNKTGMVALIGKDSSYVQKLIDENNINLEIANDNSPMQLVLSGSLEDIDKSKDIFLQNNIKRFVPLKVSAAFHSKYMLDAQKILSKEINKVTFKNNNIKIISNYDGGIYEDNSMIMKNLQNQMANKVNWTKSIKTLEQTQERKIIEFGPNKVLSGLIKRISDKFDIISINEISDIK